MNTYFSCDVLLYHYSHMISVDLALLLDVNPAIKDSWELGAEFKLEDSCRLAVEVLVVAYVGRRERAFDYIAFALAVGSFGDRQLINLFLFCQLLELEGFRNGFLPDPNHLILD